MIDLLDTNTCIRYINRYSASIISRLQNLSPDDVAICDVVKFELYYGAYNSSQTERNLDTLREFFLEFTSLPFEGQAACICGRLRAQLKAKRSPTRHPFRQVQGGGTPRPGETAIPPAKEIEGSELSSQGSDSTLQVTAQLVKLKEPKSLGVAIALAIGPTSNSLNNGVRLTYSSAMIS